MLRSLLVILFVLAACTDVRRIAIGHSFDEKGRPCTTFKTERENDPKVLYETECGSERARAEPIPSLALPEPPAVPVSPQSKP